MGGGWAVSEGNVNKEELKKGLNEIVQEYLGAQQAPTGEQEAQGPTEEAQPAAEGQEAIEAPQAPTEEGGGEEAVAEQAPQEAQPEQEVPQPQAQPQAQAQAPPPPPPAQPAVQPQPQEDWIEEIRKRKQLFDELFDFARQVSQASPEQLALTRDLIREIFGLGEERKEAPQPSPPPQPVIVEKPVIKEVQVPQPVVPKEISEKVENVDSRMAALEQKLAKYDEILSRIAEAMDRNSAMMDEITRLREELARTRQEYEQKLQSLQQQAMVIPKSRIVRPDGVVLEEYDFHPLLKAQEKAAEYRYSVWGPALIEEMRATRADISAGINRIASLIESVLTPELKKRAPQIAEDIQERFRRLVGGMLTPEERERELAELEAKVAEAQKVVQQAAQQAAASAASSGAAAEGAGK
jgi:Predicted membrane protein